MRNLAAWIQRNGRILITALVAALVLLGYINRVAVGEFIWGLISWFIQEIFIPTAVLGLMIWGVARILGYGVWWGKKPQKKD